MATVELEQAYRTIADAVDKENQQGGIARGVVQQIGWAVGVNLSDRPVNGDMWSEQNMLRVLDRVRSMVAELSLVRQQREGGR